MTFILANDDREPEDFNIDYDAPRASLKSLFFS